MSPKIGTRTALFVLFAASLACTLVPGSSPPGPGDPVATSVAATLSARETSPPPEPDATEIPPGPTPSPTPEPLPLQVAYVREGEVYLWSEGGAAAPVTALGDVNGVKISDDGQILAVIRQLDPTTQEIWAVSTDGSDPRVLVSAADLEGMSSHEDAISTHPGDLDWVPGTHTLAFNTHPVFEGPGLFLADDLRLVNADSGDLTTLLPPGSGGKFKYSPDGSKLALITPEQISVINPDGTGRVDLFSFPFIYSYSEYALYPNPVWVPEGSALRVVIPPQDPLGSPGEKSVVWHLPTDGSSPSRLGEFLTVYYFVHRPRLSPDTEQLAYQAPSSGDPGDRISELHLTAVDGTGDILYDSGQLTFHAWSPDSSHFIYSQEGSPPQVGRRGARPQAIRGAGLIRDVRWVDQDRYLYLNRDSGAWELWQGDLDGPNLLLDSTPGNSMPYDFTP